MTGDHRANKGTRRYDITKGKQAKKNGVYGKVGSKNLRN